MAKGKAVIALRDHLRDYGVFVATANKKRIAENIADVRENEIFHEQIEAEIDYQMKKGIIFKSQFNPDPTKKQGSAY